jgi:hypothetical protein
VDVIVVQPANDSSRSTASSQLLIGEPRFRFNERGNRQQESRVRGRDF